MQNRTFGPDLMTMNRILISVVSLVADRAGLGACRNVQNRTPAE
jgi:hypothetical protein